ncbi:hypothetical protein ABG067_005572 [Albugo candida]
MVAIQQRWFCVATQLSAWLWYRLRFVQCGKYYKYGISVTEPRSRFHSCYNAIIDAGVKRLRPLEIAGTTAKVVVYSETNLLDRTIQARFPRNCLMEVFDGYNPSRNNAILIGKAFAIFSVESQRNFLINLKIEIHKEYTIFWRQVDYKLYWCRGETDDINELENDHSSLFAPMELVSFLSEQMENMPIYRRRNGVDPALAALLWQIQTFSSRKKTLYTAAFDISHSEECHDILRICSDDQIFALVPSEHGNHDLVMLSKEASSCIEKSDNCKFKSVDQKAYWFENNDPSLEQPPQASINQEKPLPDVVVATYKEGLHQKCINCIAFTDKEEFHTLLSSIITGSSTTTAKMLQIRSQCVYKTSLCTSVMLRPGHVYELLQALQLTDGNDENADYNIEVAKVVSISYKGKWECAKCLFRYFEVFYSDPIKKLLWVNPDHSPSLKCNQKCGPTDVPKDDPEVTYLPPRPVKFAKNNFLEQGESSSLTNS